MKTIKQNRLIVYSGIGLEDSMDLPRAFSAFLSAPCKMEALSEMQIKEQ